jgi:hypothetical protein
MIELIFTACSILNGAQCHEVKMVYQDVSLMTCMMQGQQPIADWKNTHPNWSVMGKYSCRPAGMYADL